MPGIFDADGMACMRAGACAFPGADNALEPPPALLMESTPPAPPPALLARPPSPPPGPDGCERPLSAGADATRGSGG